MRARLILLCFVLALLPAEAARHFRWASQGDATSMDPQAQSENVTNQLSAMVYEELLQRDKKMELVPWLATSYENPEPTKWVFHLRKNLRWSDDSTANSNRPIASGRLIMKSPRSEHGRSGCLPREQVECRGQAAGKKR